MHPRRTAAAVLAGVALLAGAADATGSSSLDGARRTNWTYTGRLDESTLATPGQGRNPADAALAPHPSDCTTSSCDISRVRLSVPRGRQSGQFSYQVTFVGTTLGEPNVASSASAALYDSRGNEVLVTPFCCSMWSMRLDSPRLPAGSYTIVIYNQGAPTSFEATLRWVANPPHRSSR